jgi:allantoin racemase
MKILIINPNSDEKMTDAIRKTAESFAGGAYDTVCRSAPDAPRFIETYEVIIHAMPGMIRLVKETTADACVIACHCDPHLDLMKEITTKPVVGIGEASMKIASMLGHRFSVISATNHSIPQKEALIRKYHLQELLASIRATEQKNIEGYLQAAQTALNDGAEVIVLGCAGMTGLDKQLERSLGVPVLDGVICALIIAAGLVRYGVSTSKRRRYNPNI